MNKAAFLDRDGVINRKAREGEYVTRWEEFHFLPDVAEAIALLKQAGFLAVIVTNQRCVAKGLITTAELEFLHGRMCDVLTRNGAKIDAIYYCPHDLHPQCVCRKPQPGMLLRAATAHGIDLSSSWMIGDSEIDVQAGRNAGCKTAMVTAGRNQIGADVKAASLLEVVQGMLRFVQPTVAMNDTP